MKRFAFASLALLALLLVGCKIVGTTGNPDDLTGTWNAIASMFAEVYPLKVTQASVSSTDYEGTWTARTVSGPAFPTVSVDASNPAVTTTTHVANETTTTTTTYNMVITADGSFTFTQIQSLVQAARALIAASATGTALTNGWPAIVDGSRTVTTVVTGTVTDPNGTGRYQDSVTTTQSVVASGTDFIGVSFNLNVGAGNVAVNMSATSQSISRSVTSSEVAKNALSYLTYVSGLTQTVFGTTPTAAYQNKVDTAWALVVVKAGTYTLTKTVTTTQAARAAIAGTATVAPSPAILVGTTVETTVYTGTLTSSMFGDGKFIDFVVDSAAVTSTGTGALISPTFPVAALASSGDTSPFVWEYSITEGKTSTYMTVNQNANIVSGPVYAVFLKAAS